MKKYLRETKIIDYSSSNIQILAKKLAKNYKTDIDIAKRCFEYQKNTFCLHGLNAIYLKNFGWYRVDARGDKEGVNAQFNPPYEKLAFELGESEYNFHDIEIENLNIYNEICKR
jgi:hypothetical protein